jgi:uncharacterized protein (TIGR02271 family)
MISQNQAADLMGATAYSQSGDKIGKVGQIFLDDETGAPEWVTVSTGLFGGKENFIPIANGTWDGEKLTVPFDKALVSDAPSVDVDSGHLSQEEEAQLYRHYSMEYTERTSDSGYADTSAGVTTGTTTDTTTDRVTEGHDTSGPTTDDAMTRSEERLRVGTEKVEQGRVRLRKYVVTEQQQVPVTTTREEVRLEREPITEANRGQAMSGPDISEEEHEVILHEERPVVAKETVPVERVRLGTEAVTEQTTVSEEIRKEQIEVDGDGRTVTGNETDINRR